MGAGFKITTVNGDPVEFGDKLNLDNNQIINVADPTAAGHATTKGYVDTALFNLVNGAPTQLDTLGEIANSLGDDAAFSTTMTTALALKDTIVDVNTKDANTLTSANSYTDTSIAAIPATDLSAYSTTVQVEALPVSTFTNDAGYSTTTGTVTPTSTDTFTNKSGAISQWTNDAGYLTTETDSQTLSFANPNLTISNGNVVDLSSLTPTVPVTSVNTLIGAVVLDTDNIAEGSTNLYHTTPRVQAVIDTNTAGFLDATSEIHVISDTTTGTYAPPKMLNRNGNSTAFDFVTDDQTYAGAYSARLGLISWANLASNNVAVATFKSTNDKSLFQLSATGSADDGSHDMDFKLRGATGYLSTRDNSSAGGALTDMTIEGTNLKLKSPIINFNDNFTFPNADGTVDQVMSTDGAGNLSWVDGGGGSIALSDLTDVAELNLQNNDLLMYNSTASEWQNTNLGVSVTPTLSGASAQLAGTLYTITISNHATYDDPAYFVEVYTGTTRVVINDNVTDNQDGTLSFAAPAAGTYQIRVKCQDFGDLQSEIATYALTTSQFGGTYRYWRITAVTSDGPTNYWGLWDLRFYTGAGQTGVQYPGNMTSDTNPSPYVASALHTYNSTYGPFRAFDSSINSFYWTIGSSSTQQQAQWLKLDLGSAVSISSMRYFIAGNVAYFPRSMSVEASDTGAFAGEETLIINADGLILYPTNNLIG